MNGKIIPDDIYMEELGVLNIFENTVTIKDTDGKPLEINSHALMARRAMSVRDARKNASQYKADTINAIVFAHKDDVFEDPKTLSFFANFKGMRLIDYSELKPTKCTWADGDKKMPSNKGHNIPQSKCFTKYLEEKNYLISFLENIL